MQLRRTLRDDVDGAGVLDPAAIAQVAAESWPVVRDADELHDALASLIVTPPVAEWSAWFAQLVARASRPVRLTLFWTCAERERAGARRILAARRAAKR